MRKTFGLNNRGISTLQVGYTLFDVRVPMSNTFEWGGLVGFQIFVGYDVVGVCNGGACYE